MQLKRIHGLSHLVKEFQRISEVLILNHSKQDI